MKEGKNQSLQLLRVLAMIMIIFEHLLSHISFPLQSLLVQLGNSGVLIFLFLSGYLYGRKDITHWGKWCVKRIKRICVPMWIFMIIDFIVEWLLWESFSIKQVFVYLFNLQGILGFNFGGMNLWFLTLLMICYFTTPLLQWLKKKHLNWEIGIIVFISAIFVQIITAYYMNIMVIVGHPLSWCIIAVGMYVFGYFAGDMILSETITKTKIILITCIMLITSVVVLLARSIFDGKIVYDRIIALYGMVVIDLWMCTVVYKIGRKIKSGSLQKIINYVDTISYEFYLVHGLVITVLVFNGVLGMSTWLYIGSAFILSWLAALVLHKVCERICILGVKKEREK